MSRLGKVVAVVAVAGSVAWVGHQIVRHHDKVERAHEDISEFIGAVRERHQHDSNLAIDYVVPDFKREDGTQAWTSPAADDSNSLAEPQIVFDSVKSMAGDETDGSSSLATGGSGHGDGAIGWVRQWRRHHKDEEHSDSDDEQGERRRHGRRGRRGCHKPSQGGVSDHEQHSGDNMEQQSWAVVGDDSTVVTSVAQVETLIGGPYDNEQQIPEQQAVIDPMPELEDDHEAHHRGDADEGFSGSRRHHGRRSRDEKHFRKIESSLSEEEKVEFRRLRREARRLHCGAARTAGGFAAGAAFAGGIAHLARLRRERRQAATAVGVQCAGAQCEGETNSSPSVTNA